MEVSMTNALKIKLDDVIIEAGKFNEIYLAALHDRLKNSSEEVFLDLSAAGSMLNLTNEDITDAIYHTCRRLKDCISIKGVAVPRTFLLADGEKAFLDGSLTMNLLGRLMKKHGDYHYFIGAKDVSEDLRGLIRDPFILCEDQSFV